MTTSNQGLFSLFKTPDQVRQEQVAKLQQMGQQNSNMLLNTRTRSGLASGLLAQGAAAAQYMPQAADRFARGMIGAAGDLAGALGNEEAKEALKQGAMTPEERQARSQQESLSKIAGSKDPAALEAYAQKIAQSNPRAAEAIMAKAAQLRQAALDQRMASAKEQEIIANTAKTIAETRGIDYELAYDQATEMYRTRKLAGEAAQSEAAGQVASQTVQTQITQAQATLDNTLANSGFTRMQTRNLSQSIAQEAELHPERVAKLQEEIKSEKVARRLTTAQANRTEKLTLEELEKMAAETKLLGYQQKATEALTAQREAELAKMDSTDFLTELSNLDASDEEKQRLLAARLESMSAGGDAGFDPNSAIGKARLEKAMEVAELGVEANKSLERSETILRALDTASTGKFSTVEAFAASWMGQLGFEGAKAETVANELVQVLRGELVLDKAGNLKGALSDKDLAFLEKTVPSPDMSVQGLRTIFGRMAAEHAGDAYAAQIMDKVVSQASMGDIKGMEVNSLTAAYQAAGRALYLKQLQDAKRLPEDFVIRMPTQAQFDTMAKYKQFK